MVKLIMEKSSKNNQSNISSLSRIQSPPPLPCKSSNTTDNVSVQRSLPQRTKSSEILLTKNPPPLPKKQSHLEMRSPPSPPKRKTDPEVKSPNKQISSNTKLNGVLSLDLDCSISIVKNGLKEEISNGIQIYVTKDSSATNFVIRSTGQVFFTSANKKPPSIRPKLFRYLLVNSEYQFYFLHFPKTIQYEDIKKFEKIMLDFTAFQMIEDLTTYEKETNQLQYPIVVCITDFKANKKDQLTIKVGDKIQLHKKENDGWAFGELNKKSGWFPFANVKYEKYTSEKILNTTAKYIGIGGQKIGSGLVSGAEILGKGMHKGTEYIKSHTKQHEEEEQPKNYETAKKVVDGGKKVSGGIVTVTSKTVQGIDRGFTYVGKKITEGKEALIPKKEEEEEEKKINPTKEAALNVGKATVGALKSVVNGVVDGVTITASSVRDNTSEIVEHKKGKEAAEITRTSFNIVGDTAKGTANAVEIILPLTTPFGLVFRTAKGVAIGIATCASLEDAKAGESWYYNSISVTILRKEKKRWMHLKTTALVFFEEVNSKPEEYIALCDILNLKFSEPNEKNKEHQKINCTFEIETRLGYYTIVTNTEEERTLWINAIQNLKIL